MINASDIFATMIWWARRRLAGSDEVKLAPRYFDPAAMSAIVRAPNTICNTIDAYAKGFSDISFNSKKIILHLGQIWNFGQKSKLWSKIEILVKNRNFSQKSNFLSKIEILVKNRNFGQKSNFWSKIEILIKNRNVRQKPNFLSRIEILVKNQNFGQKSKFC